MPDQLSMFDAAPPRFARARRSDQRSSHLAAARIESTGSAKRYAQRCLEAVQAHPGLTTQELAKASKLEAYKMGKRLPELVKAGKLRRVDSDAVPPPIPCAVGGSVATRWYPA